MRYELFGDSTRGELLRLLPDDFDFTGKRVLDFGCGAGRTLRHFLAEAEQAEIWGADIDARSVEWLEANLCPPLHVVRTSPEPPLPFDSGSFDLIWAISVFTHLADTSLPWLAELHRLLAPGGLLIASYMGEWNSEAIAGEPWDPDRIGCNVLQHDQPWDRGGPMVLMSDWWVREHWGRGFEFAATSPRVHNQTWVLLRKRDAEISVADLEAPADDPREFEALRHNLAQVQAEVEALGSRLAERERFVADLERSRSWRLLQALRAPLVPRRRDSAGQAE